MKQTTTIHIECIIKDGKLNIQGAAQLIRSGLLPVIFRYTIRTSRHGKNKEGIREYMPKRRGWNRFFDNAKIIANPDNTILFRNDTSSKIKGQKPQYYPSAEYLFNYFRVDKIPNSEKIAAVFVPYGQRIFNVLDTPRTFKFAIGFYKEVAKTAAFNFSFLRTNLAVFRVRVEAQVNAEGKVDMYYRLSR